MLKILVTGATGNVGREVINLLSNHNYDLYAAVRNTEKAHATFNSSGERHINCVEFDFTNPSTFASAFEGVNKLFLVRPPALANVRKQIAPALEAAKSAGVEHIVFLSLLGAERNRIVPHALIEQYINKLNIPATFLRAGFFMQNLSMFQLDTVLRFLLDSLVLESQKKTHKKRKPGGSAKSGGRRKGRDNPTEGQVLLEREEMNVTNIGAFTVAP